MRSPQDQCIHERLQMLGAEPTDGEMLREASGAASKPAQGQDPMAHTGRSEQREGGEPQ